MAETLKGILRFVILSPQSNKNGIMIEARQQDPPLYIHSIKIQFDYSFDLYVFHHCLELPVIA